MNKGVSTSKVVRARFVSVQTWMGILAIAGLSACTATTSGPQPTVKQVIETAPADLQLACATKAQSAFKTSRTVLPVRSSKVSAQAFEVGLKSGSQNFKCDIQPDGTILKVTKA